MIKLLSPAKINLFLRVLGKRPDGYHEISSLFQAIGLFDTLTIALSDKDRFTCSDPTLPLDDRNLVIKALKVFREHSKRKFSVSIHLDKKIPSQAGLGGGSSNAATTLFGLNQMIGSPFTEDQLAKWGSQIGSDVAFFFSPGLALCEGRGERVIPQPPLPGFHVELFKPDFGLSTPEVYGALDLQSVSEESPQDLLNNFYSGRPEFVNDLETAALKIKPELLKFREALLHNGHKPLLMSGSGSCYFAPANDRGYPALTRSHGEWYQA